MTITLHYDEHTDKLRLDCGPRDIDLARQVPGLQYRDGCWQGPAAWSTALAARGVFKDEMLLTPECDAWGFEHVLEETQAEYDRTDEQRYVWDDGLRPLQVRGVNFLLGRDAALLADDPGAGKGVMAAKAASLLPDKAFPMLIVTPRSVKWGHHRELTKWAPNCHPVVVSGTAPQRRKLLAEGLAHPRGVLVMNWEAVRGHSMLASYGSKARTDEEKQPKELNGGVIKTVLLDEAHRAGDPSAKQTLAVKAVVQESTRRWATTATPVRSPIAYWSLLNLLLPREFTSRTKFQDRYCLTETVWVAAGKSVDKVRAFNPRTEAELRRIVSRIWMRRPIEEIAPELDGLLSRSVRWVEMEAKQRKAYRDMAKEMIAKLDSGILVTTSPMVKSGRLLQLASALPVLGSDGEVIGMEAPSSKVQALLDILADRPDEQVVVFAESRKLIELVSRVLTTKKISWTKITGPESEAERKLAEDEFQAGQHRVILLTYGAGREGITLTSATTQVMLQRSFELVKNEQADGRCLRIGQTKPVEIIDVITINTYDESCFKAGVYKEATAQQVLQDPNWVRRELSQC